jgi:hypothetical protein
LAEAAEAEAARAQAAAELAELIAQEDADLIIYQDNLSTA